MNQFAISSELNLQQPTPSAGQSIGQAPPFANIQNSSGTGASMVPNPQPRILEERPLETPAKIQAIEQVYAELKSHMK
jgi:hypothetical protein